MLNCAAAELDNVAVKARSDSCISQWLANHGALDGTTMRATGNGWRRRGRRRLQRALAGHASPRRPASRGTADRPAPGLRAAAETARRERTEYLTAFEGLDASIITWIG
jgi:hypothetical protein